jgi:3-deoxy-D-manno-octulosonate 8-phosphate phosphatase (KDO 8-P phosphatase)
MNRPDVLSNDELIDRARDVRLIVMDVDGVLSDGVIAVDDEGREHKHFHVRDGSAIAGWIRSGRHAAILSGRKARCVDHRARELGIPYVLQGNPRKIEGLQEILGRTEATLRQTCFIGDDLPDLPLFGMVGLSACPSDAVEEILAASHFVSRHPGGRGAVHELIRLVMEAQGLWKSHVDWYFHRESVDR